MDGIENEQLLTNEKLLTFESMYDFCMEPTLGNIYRIAPEVFRMKSQSGHIEIENDFGSVDIVYSSLSDNRKKFDVRIDFPKEIFDSFSNTKEDLFKNDELLSLESLHSCFTNTPNGKTFICTILVNNKKGTEMLTPLKV